MGINAIIIVTLSVIIPVLYAVNADATRSPRYSAELRGPRSPHYRQWEWTTVH